MADEPTNFKYTLQQQTTGTVVGAFEGNGNVSEYPEPYRSYAEAAETKKLFSVEIEGERFSNIEVTAEPSE
jgi:hypothetical protein